MTSQASRPTRTSPSSAIHAPATAWLDWSSPIGELRLVQTAGQLSAIWFRDSPHCRDIEAPQAEQAADFQPTLDQLSEYFAGTRREFNLDLAPEGTEFQHRVWACLRTIPHGESRTYAWLARAIQQPSAVRAVASANARNPISILIPCHRVIGSDGRLSGYAGGIDRKAWLLELEGHPARFREGA